MAAWEFAKTVIVLEGSGFQRCTAGTAPDYHYYYTLFLQEARCVLQKNCSKRLPQSYPLLDSGSKQDSINLGHGAQYLHRPPPAGPRWD